MSNKKSIFKTFMIFLLVLIYSGCSVSSVYNKKGMELINSGKYEDAVKYYENLLKKDPGK